MSLAEIKRRSKDDQRIEQKIRSLADPAARQPDLKFLTLDYAKSALAQSDNLLDVTVDAGLSRVRRLHDLCIECEAMRPGEFRRRGDHGFSSTVVGPNRVINVTIIWK